MINPTLTPDAYVMERAICDKAKVFWDANANFSKSGWSSMGPGLAAHPDFAACDNAMRGRVEQFELLRDIPEKIGAYIAQSGQGMSHSLSVVVWTGLPIGNATETARWLTPGSYVSSHMHQYSATIGGRKYTGRGGGVGMYILLRETAESKRSNPR